MVGFCISSAGRDFRLVRGCLAWLLRFAVRTCDLRRYNGGIDRSSRNGGLAGRGSSGWWGVFVLLAGLQRWILCSVSAYPTVSAQLLVHLSVILIKELTSLLHPIRHHQRSSFVPPSRERWSQIPHRSPARFSRPQPIAAGTADFACRYE